MNKYRIPSARLQSWNYGSDGHYFITICTTHRAFLFGEIRDGEMICNDMGKIAEQFWLEIPIHFPFVELGNYVVMPNHVHGILIIDKSLNEKTVVDDGAVMGDGPVETPELGVSTPTHNNPAIFGNDDAIFRNDAADARQHTVNASEKWKPATIGVIVNQYKRKVTIECRKIHSGFGWQSRFHDHIIRDEQSFENIQHYIETNPQNWNNDKFRTSST